jgi:hypothetical protein
MCSEAMSVHARLVKSNPSISTCAKTGLHLLYVDIEFIAPDHHEMLQNYKLSQRRMWGKNTILSWSLSEESSYNAIVAIKA